MRIYQPQNRNFHTPRPLRKDVSITNIAVAGREAKKFEIETFELIPLPFDPPDFKEGIMYEIVPPSKVTVIERYIVIPTEGAFMY